MWKRLKTTTIEDRSEEDMEKYKYVYNVTFHIYNIMLCNCETVVISISWCMCSISNYNSWCMSDTNTKPICKFKSSDNIEEDDFMSDILTITSAWNSEVYDKICSWFLSTKIHFGRPWWHNAGYYTCLQTKE